MSITSSSSPSTSRYNEPVEAEKTIGNLIWVDQGRMSGQPCFFGTRVPVSILFDYLETGDSVDDFLVQYPGVTREQAMGVIGLSKQGLEDIIRAA